MPSDSKKARDAAKKAAVKNRTKARDTKRIHEEVDGCGTPPRSSTPDEDSTVVEDEQSTVITS
jgi:hypothetical protein